MATITLTPLSTMLWVTVPFWVPVIFAAYALGKKQVSLKFVFVALTTAAIALGVCWHKAWHFF